MFDNVVENDELTTHLVMPSFAFKAAISRFDMPSTGLDCLGTFRSCLGRLLISHGVELGVELKFFLLWSSYICRLLVGTRRCGCGELKFRPTNQNV